MDAHWYVGTSTQEGIPKTRLIPETNTSGFMINFHKLKRMWFDNKTQLFIPT